MAERFKDHGCRSRSPKAAGEETANDDAMKRMYFVMFNKERPLTMA